MRNSRTRTRGLAVVEIVLAVGLASVVGFLGFSEFDVARRAARVAEANRQLGRVNQAAEAYLIDNGGYPLMLADSWLLPKSTAAMSDWRLLSTPIQYLDVVPRDPFFDTISILNPMGVFAMYGIGRYGGHGNHPKTTWLAWSVGPDRVTQTGSYRSLAAIVANESLQAPQIGGQTPEEFGGRGSVYNGMRYDPTNGLVSVGDIYAFNQTAQ